MIFTIISTSSSMFKKNKVRLEVFTAQYKINVLLGY